jgi:large subunit ribosomal protein L32
MPVPKRRTSKSKVRSRRASNMKYKFKTFMYCKECSEPKIAHHVCSYCGKYAGKQILKISK